MTEHERMKFIALRADNDALRVENAALRADAKRMDWLETQSCWIGVEGEFELRPIISAGGCYTQTVRDSVDAARTK